MTVDVALFVLAAVWWVAVFWYAARLIGGRVRRSAMSWHLLVMGVLIAGIATEELVMQRWYGGWVHHDAAVTVFVLTGIYLGLDRLAILRATRRRAGTPQPTNTH